MNPQESPADKTQPLLPQTAQIRQEKLNNLTWTPTELLFKNQHKIKFRRSIFGSYLEAFNYQQNQNGFLNRNKLDMTNWDMKQYSAIEKRVTFQKNEVSDDLLELLFKAVNETECVDWEFLYKNLVTLRITDFHITFLDNRLLNFKNLRVLILCGNWIRDISGKNLPRNLQFLELYANEISDIRALSAKPPETLFHIGLGRNRLTHASELCFSKNSLKFRQLRTLDLSDNDICELIDILTQLESLTTLTGLSLEGNPCATCMGYKDAVLQKLPQLIYLDNTEVLEKDRIVVNLEEEVLRNAALVFSCHRIMGLPPPPKEKGVLQTIHIEVLLPLLEEISQEAPEDFVQDENEEQRADDSKGKKAKGKDKTTKPSKSKKSKSSKKSTIKAPSPYEADDEYAIARKLRIKSTAFKTDRTAWAKIIQFPEETLVIEPPERDLRAIRDTFRSTVNVKIIYLKVQVAGKVKGRSKEKDKSKKKDKNERFNKSETTKPKEEPQETILKKVTLANFFCDLHTPNWSDKTLDFYWAAHPKSNPKAIQVEGSLKAINYIEGKSKVKKKGKQENPTAMEPSKEPVPSIFTCQVGFGLKRASKLSSNHPMSYKL